MTPINITLAPPGTTDHLREILGGLYEPRPWEAQIDAPLEAQAKRLIQWATSQTPDHYRRSIPMQWDDHDHLITEVVTKLVRRITELEQQTGQCGETYGQPEDPPPPNTTHTAPQTSETS